MEALSLRDFGYHNYRRNYHAHARRDDHANFHGSHDSFVPGRHWRRLDGRKKKEARGGFRQVELSSPDTPVGALFGTK
jgi:hypothetical protein